LKPVSLSVETERHQPDQVREPASVDRRLPGRVQDDAEASGRERGSLRDGTPYRAASSGWTRRRATSMHFIANRCYAATCVWRECRANDLAPVPGV